LADDNNRSELDVVIKEVKRELRRLFVRSDELIKKLGNALKKVVKKEESICEEIKNALKEEIAEGVISTRTIELHCPPEWKHETKPKQRENEKNSFSKQVEEKPQQQVAATKDGKSFIINDQPEENGIKLTPANQIAEEKDNKITQFQKESDEHITSASKQNETTRYVSHIPMPFEALQKDLTTVFRTNNGKVADVFFKVSVDLGKRVAQIECCGITQQKDVTMVSTGKGILKEA